MTVLRKDNKRPTSESTRPTTALQNNPGTSRRRFLTLFSAGVIATGLFGAKTLAEEKPTTVASAGTVGAPSEKKVQPAGDKNILGYTLSVNAPANCFVGDAILVSVTNSKGEIVKGEKVEITEPSGNRFKISIDNSQNGFVARKAGDYTVRYGSNTYTVTVREMDAEISGLKKYPLGEERELIRNTASIDFHQYDPKTKTLTIFSADGKGTLIVEISLEKLNRLYSKVSGGDISEVVVATAVGPLPNGETYLQYCIYPVETKSGEIKRNTPVLILPYDNKAEQFNFAYGLIF